MTDETASSPTLADVVRARAASVRATKDDSFPELLLVFPGAILGVPLVFFGGFVVSRHAEGYMAAGVAHDEAYAGAVVAQILVAAGLITLAVLFRQGHDGRTLTIAAGAAAAAALVFVLLPNLVAGHSWLTILLALLTTLLFDALVGLVAGAIIMLVGQ